MRKKKNERRKKRELDLRSTKRHHADYGRRKKRELDLRSTKSTMQSSRL